jgi:hypothetical protein
MAIICPQFPSKKLKLNIYFVPIHLNSNYSLSYLMTHGYIILVAIGESKIYAELLMNIENIYATEII